MKYFIQLLLLVAVGFAHAKEVTLIANDGFKLKADYFAGQAKKPGVLMLHQCNADRSMYEALGKQLAAQGIHALALDFRLYGGSVTDEVSREKIRIAEPDNEKRRALTRQHRQHWPKDVIVATQYLRNRLGGKPMIGVIGASCGGTQAIRLAGKRSIGALMFFSSGMSEETLAAYQKLNSTPTFIIAAEGDTYTFNSSQQLFKLSDHGQTRLINYKGAAHGHPLFLQDPGLANNMVDWFKAQLILATR